MSYTTCLRCGGTGKYSFNPIDLDVCYGCMGAGKVPDKKTRTANSKALFTEFTTALIAGLPEHPSEATIRIADQDGQVGAMAFRRHKAITAIITERGMMWTDMGTDGRVITITVAPIAA